MKQIRKPLINLKKLTFGHFTWNSNSSILRPNELFPSVQNLTLFDFNDDSFSYFGQHLPNLQHVYLTRSDYKNSSFPFPEMFIKNPQIQTIELHGFDPEFVIKVSIHEPKLKEVELRDFPTSNEHIRFENVTTF